MKRERLPILESILRSGMYLKPSMPLYAKITFFNVVSAFCAGMFLIFGYTNYQFGQITFATFEFSLAGGFAISMLLLRLTSRYNPSAIVNSLLLYIGAAVLIITGGTVGTGVYWLLMCPLLYLNFWGRKLGLVWMMGMIILLAGIVILNALEIVRIAYTQYQMLIFLLAIAVSTFLLWLHSYLDSLKLRSLTDEAE
ncbi:MAG: hypothetical protein TR69_WS6001000110 [candidate division WS6 bacterium OLB20]|uniref:Uncharacterized protein n=1 Tax=candidate division WS6 bacterium OLB20 TaxID=1617426 RepID=A0A136M013_9BACT|nr:MAG: hypothetical protein TR69_WS6001000110 [candidate division WS6 bacterium OLB20]